MILWKGFCFCSKWGTKVLLASAFPILVFTFIIANHRPVLHCRMKPSSSEFINIYFLVLWKLLFNWALSLLSLLLNLTSFLKTCGRSHFSCVYFGIWRFIFLCFFFFFNWIPRGFYFFLVAVFLVPFVNFLYFLGK